MEIVEIFNCRKADQDSKPNDESSQGEGDAGPHPTGARLVIQRSAHLATIQHSASTGQCTGHNGHRFSPVQTNTAALAVQWLCKSRLRTQDALD